MKSGGCALYSHNSWCAAAGSVCAGGGLHANMNQIRAGSSMRRTCKSCSERGEVCAVCTLSANPVLCLLCPPHDRREAAEAFRTKILHGRGGLVCSTPVQSLGPVTYMTMRHEDVYMLCITKSNVNAMMAFQFMRSVSPDKSLLKCQGRVQPACCSHDDGFKQRCLV